MTLRKKTLLLVAITILCSIAVLHISSTSVLLKGFKDIEAQNARENVQRVTESYTEGLTKLAWMNEDWAEWDSSYRFITNRDPTYIEENLTNEALQRIKLNLIVYVNNNRQLVFGSFAEQKQQHSQLIPESLQNYLLSNDILLQQHKQQEGIILLPQGPMIISRRDILTSEGTGPSRETLIMGRYLNIEELAKQTHFQITAYQYNSKLRLQPSDFQLAHQALAISSLPFVQSLNEDEIAGYTFLKDIDGKPALLLRVQMPREIYKQGKISMGYISSLLFVVGLVFGAVTLLLLERLVLSRLARLSTGVSVIGASGNLSARVIVSGKDELSGLATNINLMLRQLHKSQKNLQSSEERYRVFLAQSLEGIWRCELERPMPINTSVNEQLNYFCDRCHLGECNDVLASIA